LEKKEFTSFDVAAAVRELKEAILDSRVSNVYQLDSKTLLFKLHKPDRPAFGLVLESAKRLHLTSYMIEKPMVPPAFCMALRKCLRNGFLTSVEQYEFERVVILSFKTKAGEFRLVLELFGEGNIILVDEKGKIAYALTYKRMRDRNILRNETFAYAPSSGKNPLKVSKEELREGLKNFGDIEIVRALARFLSIGGIYSEEILQRAGIDKTKPCSLLTEAEADTIYEDLQVLLSLVLKGKLAPSIVLDEGSRFVDVVPIRLERYSGFQLEPFSSFNEALDEFYVQIAAVQKATTGLEADELKREAERIKRIIDNQEKTLAEAETEIVKNKNIGDMIFAHVSELQVLTDKFLTTKESGKNWNTIISEVLIEKNSGKTPSTFFESLDVKSKMIHVSIDGLHFALNLHERLYDNAGRYYDQSKRAKQKMEGAKTALAETRKKLAEIKAKISETEALEHVKPTETAEQLAKRKIKHKEWFEKFHWFTSSDGFLIVAGKDAVSNEVLIKKYTDADDIVFHADVVGAPFTVIKTEGKKPSEQCLRETSEFAAAFSRGWREGFASVDVYWIKPDQLSKGAPSGEYVSHGAFVVRGERNWLRNVPLRIAIGITVNKEENLARIGGGPVDAVKAKANAYVIVVPGDLEGKTLFKNILHSLARKVSKEVRETILELPVEAIREYVPYGKGMITQL
jgi:predicted ribosome quality control (RQC) complex YloA/Tae2 family protein